MGSAKGFWRRRGARAWAVSGLAAVSMVAALAGCRPMADGPVAVASAYWAEERLLYVGDPYSGQVRLLRLDEPVQETARLIHANRLATLGIRLDPDAGRVWVLGEKTLHVHDARSGRLLTWWSAPPGVLLTQLEMREGRPMVAGADRRGYRIASDERVLRVAR